MDFLKMFSDLFKDTDVKNNYFRRRIETLLLEWKSSRVDESIHHNTYELETIRESVDKRFQEVGQKEKDFLQFHNNMFTKLMLNNQEVDGLIRKRENVGEEMLHKEMKLIEKHLEKIAMEEKRLERMQKLVNEGIKKMSLIKKCMDDTIHKLKPIPSQVQVSNTRDHEKVSEAKALDMVDAGMPRESGAQKNKGKKRNRNQVEDTCIRKNKKQQGNTYLDRDGIHKTKFYDFDKDKGNNCFAVDQIWALYDTIDGMPRIYAQIKAVLKPGFKLRVTWLEADVEDQKEIDWVKKELPYGCGRFGCGDSVEISNRLIFSHQVQCGASYVIYPRKGEVWAVFKDWDIKWISDSKEHTEFKYEIVEIVKDLVEDAGIEVAYLNEVEGFHCLFERSNKSEMIPPNELLRFSHRIPCFKVSLNEKDGVPEGSFALDSASLPTNPNKICYPGKLL